MESKYEQVEIERDVDVRDSSLMDASKNNHDNDSPLIGNESIPSVKTEDGGPDEGRSTIYSDSTHIEEVKRSEGSQSQLDDLLCHEEMGDFERVPATSTSDINSELNAISEARLPPPRPIPMIKIQSRNHMSAKDPVLMLLAHDENDNSASEDGLLCNEDMGISDSEGITPPPENDDQFPRKNGSKFSHETLDLISQYLRNGMIVDDLDEDKIVDTIKDMNKASARRRRQKSIILSHSRTVEGISSDEEAENDWRDDDIYQVNIPKKNKCDPNQVAINSMINIVDFDFFNETITNVTKKKIKDNQASKLSTRSMQKRPLDASTISMLRKSLGVIVPTRKGKRNRRYLADDSDSLLSEDKYQKSKGRGPSKALKNRDGYEIGETGDLSTLVGAMIEIEESEGRDGIASFKEPVRRSGRSRSPKNVSDMSSQQKGGGSITPPQKIKDQMESIKSLVAEFLVSKKGRGRSAKKIYTKRMKVVEILVGGSPFVLAKSITPEKKDNVKTKKTKKRRLLPTQGKTFSNEEYAPLMPETKKLKPNVTDIKKKEKRSKMNRISLKDKDPLYQHLVEYCEDNRNSLSLLDWRRRQQENSSGDYSISRLEDVFDTTLLSWEKNKKHEGSTSAQSAGLEPAREKHHNMLYGEWCSKLISCLQGSGRMMARHEFFYSDIDKAWFNTNPYFQDLAAIGIPSDIRLTSSEWSCVRRKFRKRTRRFSRRFILSQLKQLDEYRYTVRTIQNGDATEEMKRNFRYDVLEPIKVGSIVTAYHKKARLLHRGIILARDPVRHSYLVQFERKELGCEFCPDIEISSHGVPEVRLPLNESCNEPQFHGREMLGSLPYGTSYGHFVEWNKSRENVQFRTTEVERKVPAARKLEPQLLNSNESEIRRLPKAEIIEKVAERESLVKLLAKLDLAMKRKTMLLSTIEECHNIFENRLKELNVDAEKLSNEPSNKSFYDHYRWLHENLKTTNQALQVAVLHLQVMYGEGYASIVSRGGLESCRSLIDIQDHKRKWFNLLRERTAETASSIHENILAPPSLPQDPVHECRDNYISKRLFSAAELLCTVDVNRNMTDEMKQTDSKFICHELVNSALIKSTRPLRPGGSGDYYEIINRISNRESGFKALENSIAMLNAELNALQY